MSFSLLRRARWILLAAATCAVLPILAGCGSGSSTPTPSPTPSTGTGKLVDQPNWTVHSPTYALTPKKWTFLVYMNAANNLEQYGTQNVNEMEKVGSSNDVNVVVQWKRIHAASSDGDTSNSNWNDTRRYYITKDTTTNNPNQLVNSNLISQSSNIDMGSKDSLQAFVQWGVAAYPAQHYCLVLWNHGAGWRAQTLTRASESATSGVPGRGVSYDDATGNHIDTIQIPTAIDISNQGLKWDVLAFDASLMQMLEVGYEIRSKTNWIVGSEESPPGEGYPYDTILGHLVASPDQAPLAFSKQIVQDFVDVRGKTYTDLTESVIDPTKLDALVTSMDGLGSALMNAKTTWGTQIAIAAQRNTETYKYPENKDLVDFLNELTQTKSTGFPYVNDLGVTSAAQTVKTAASSAIVFNLHGTAHPQSNGIAIYLPSPKTYQSIDIVQSDGFGQRFTALSFAQAAPNWTNFLQNGPN